MVTMIVMTNYERLIRLAMLPWRWMLSKITSHSTIDVTIVSTIMVEFPNQLGFLSAWSSKPMQNISIVGITFAIVSSNTLLATSPRWCHFSWQGSATSVAICLRRITSLHVSSLQSVSLVSLYLLLAALIISPTSSDVDGGVLSLCKGRVVPFHVRRNIPWGVHF